MLTDTLLIKELPISEAELATPRPPTRPPRRETWRSRLLIFLTCSLAALLVLHILITYLQTTDLFPTNCAALINSTDYTRAVNLQPQYQEMAAVQLNNHLDGGAPTALVQVTTHNSENSLDVYIFGCSMQQNHPHLIQLLARQRLARGTAEITSDSTLLTANADTNIDPDNTVLLQPFQQNVYQEYSWQQGHFVQIAFPGFYPVTSRFEAQELQQNANFNQQQQILWADPSATALQMSRDLLHWTNHPQANLVSETRTTAQIELTEQQPPVTLEVTLQRLVQTNNTGLWFVTSAHTPGLVLASVNALNQPLSVTEASPIRFSGASALIDGQTTGTLFDHTLTPISTAENVPITVQPTSAYTGSLTYNHIARGQQGVLLIESLPQPQNYAKEPGQLILTSVILN